jgi:hypothetical protein
MATIGSRLKPFLIRTIIRKPIIAEEITDFVVFIRGIEGISLRADRKIKIRNRISETTVAYAAPL